MLNDRMQPAGKYCYCYLMYGQPQFGLGNTETTNVMIAEEFNKHQKVEEMIGTHAFAPSRIFSADKTRVLRVCVSSRVLSVRGKGKQVSWHQEIRGPQYDIIFPANANRQFIQPTFLFPKTNIKRISF
jgi:hypothetical protein